MRSREWDQEQNGPPAPKIKPTHSRVFDTNSPFAVLVKNTHDLIVTTVPYHCSKEQKSIS